MHQPNKKYKIKIFKKKILNSRGKKIGKKVSLKILQVLNNYCLLRKITVEFKDNNEA